MSGEQSYLAKANEHMKLQEYEAVIANLDKALEINPENKQAYLKKGYALNELGHKEAAITAYDKAIEIDPRDTLAHIDKGSILNSLGQREAALDSYEKAIKLNPYYTLTHYNKGLVLNHLGLKEDALDSLKKAIEIDPRYEDAHFAIGEILSSLDQKKEAMDAYKKALEINPNNADTANRIGECLANLDKVKEAVDAYNKAIKINPEDSYAYVNRGFVLNNLGQKEAALISLKKAIEIDPQNDMVHSVIGHILFSLGQKEASLDAYKKALEINPNNAHAANQIGECLTDLGKFKEAIDAYDYTIKIDPEDKYAYSNKGFVLYHLGEIEEAIKWYDKQIEIVPDWGPYLKKGRALQDLNKSAEALEYFQKGMDIINRGKLEGNQFKHPNGLDETLNDLELQLISAIKELLDLHTEKVTEDEPEEVKSYIQNLDKKRDALKLKFINAAFSVNKNGSKQQEDLDKLKKELEEVKNMYKQLAADIQDSGMKELAEVKRGFKSLEEQDPELLAYCKTFYWTAINLFGAYRAISTGLIQANFEAVTKEKEALFVKGAKTATSLLTDVASGIPFVGGVMTLLDAVIDGIYNTVKENRLNNKVAAINKVIQAKLGTEDEISLNVSKAALAITLAKKKAILYPEIPSPNSATTSQKVKAGLKWLAEKVDEIKEKVLPSIDLHDKASIGATLALQDVTLFMAYICKNYESIIKRTETLDKQILSIVEYNGLELMLEERKDDLLEVEITQQRSACCTMF